MIRRALRLTTVSLVLQQLATAAVIVLLFLLWLRIPDSSWFYVLVTVFVTALLIAAIGIGETRIFCLLTKREPTRATYIRGTLILLVAFALWYGVDTCIAHLSNTYDSLWAGYWNSRFPHSLRNFFSYSHISLWLGWFWSILEWGITGLLCVAAFHFIATPDPRPAARRNLRSMTWWITFLVAMQFVPWFTGKITGWTPGHGLGIETVSLILRMASVVLLDTILVVFLFVTFASFSQPTAE